MGRFYLSYRMNLEEPLIISNGSQIGNVLQSQDHIPGSSMLGVCASLYIRAGKSVEKAKGAYSDEFRSLFLSKKTIFSPAYPLSNEGHRCFPMPFSVLGCKYYGFREPIEPYPDMHGFEDYLYKPIPEKCLAGNDDGRCNASLEHKGGFAFLDPRYHYCNMDVKRQILSHNQVSKILEDKRLFSFESLTEGQEFYGEISFSREDQRELIIGLLENNSVVKLGKAKNRGYGRVSINNLESTGHSFCDEFAETSNNYSLFSIYLLSDAILVDRNLNYCAAIDKENLAFWSDLPGVCGLNVYLEPDGKFKSFYKTNRVLGFNQHRGMPLPMERTIEKGSVFTVSYDGKEEDIAGALTKLQTNGLGLRKNEGFGMVVINHKIHGQPAAEEGT